MSEHTLEATPQRRRRARLEGKFPRSRELTISALSLLVLAAGFYGGGGWLHSSADLMRSHLTGAAELSVDTDKIAALTTQPLAKTMATIFPALAIGLIAMVGIQLTQGGPVWLPDRVLPDLNRVGPANATRFLSADRAIRALFALFKLIIGLAVMLGGIWLSRASLWATQSGSLFESVATVAGALVRITLAVVVSVALLSALEYGARLWSYYRSLRMSVNELRDEQRGKRTMRVESSLAAGDDGGNGGRERRA